ncbi:MAG: hypothetical protein Q9O62_11645 [Ardenticatenia bacterium]|nr:hypothetical protein [Ardenticatenia bacterium]
MKLLIVLPLSLGALFLTVGLLADNRGALAIALVFLGLSLLAFSVK